jgi:hypothetical protein
MIEVEDHLFYVDAALDGMIDIVVGLGDELANTRPDLPGANSPFAILTHCLGVMEFWGGHAIAGRTIQRDRAAEFRATGHVDELVARARRAREQLAEDLTGLDPDAAPRGQLDPDDRSLPLGRTQGGVLLHIHEELFQHLGQVEITRDVLRAAPADSPT